jgi:hypothetical protein
MSRPGVLLRSLAARVLDAQTMERLVDPAVADLQAEYGAAVSEGRLWRGEVIRIAGYVALVKVFAVCGWRRAIYGDLAWTTDDRRALVRVIGFSVVPVVTITTLLELPPLLTQSFRSDSIKPPMLLTLIPQALTIALPVGVMLGILFGLRGRALSRRLMRAIMAMEVICSAASFTNLAWTLPMPTRRSECSWPRETASTLEPSNPPKRAQRADAQ